MLPTVPNEPCPDMRLTPRDESRRILTPTAPSVIAVPETCSRSHPIGPQFSAEDSAALPPCDTLVRGSVAGAASKSPPSPRTTEANMVRKRKVEKARTLGVMPTGPF